MLIRMVDFLNQALCQDREVVSKMFLDIAIHADEETINHPTIQVTMDDKLRLIGLLNGLFLQNGNEPLYISLRDDATIDHFYTNRV